MENKIILDNLNDLQKLDLSQISYLEINDEGRKKINSGGITVAELKFYLEEPNRPFCGNAMLKNETFYSAANNVLGTTASLPTQSQVVDSLVKNGLGGLKVFNISDSEKAYTNGFQALSFQDSVGNVGISYRGSDADFTKGGLWDWIEADFLEYFFDNSRQRVEAIEYFNTNKSQYGNNYLYGHSLGGNLTSHVFVENHDEIKEAFTINGNPINQKLLDTPEKLAAFNNPKKYNCNIVCGDIVGHFKSFTEYESNVKYIRNNETMNNNFASAHLVQASAVDENGKFIQATKQEMVQKMGGLQMSIMNFCKYIKEGMNRVGEKFENVYKMSKETFEAYRYDMYNFFEKKFEEFGIKVDLNTSIKDDDLIDKFQAATKKAEQDEINKVLKSIEQNRVTQMNTQNETQVARHI